MDQQKIDWKHRQNQERTTRVCREIEAEWLKSVGAKVDRIPDTVAYAINRRIVGMRLWRQRMEQPNGPGDLFRERETAAWRLDCIRKQHRKSGTVDSLLDKNFGTALDDRLQGL